MTSTFRDKTTGDLVLPEEMVRAIYYCWSKKVCVTSLLAGFQRDVLNLGLNNQSFTKGQARTADPDINPEFDSAFTEWKMKNPGVEEEEGLVYFSTGQRVTRRLKKSLEEERHEAIQEFRQGLKNRHALELLEYLDNAPERPLARIVRQDLPIAWEAMLAMPDGVRKPKGKDWDTLTKDERGAHRDWARKRMTLDILWEAKSFSGVDYKTVDNSPRLFATTRGILNLPRKIREILLAGCVQFDLSSCQVAICAKLYNRKRTTELLRTRVKLWTVILDFMGAADSGTDITKRGVYSTLFGKGEKAVQELLIDGDVVCDGLEPDQAKLFSRHYVVRDLVIAKDMARRAFKRDRGAEDAFGRFIKLDKIDKPSENGRLRSLMSQIIQSYELKMMLSILPVFKAKRNSKLYLLAWLHDGIVVHFGDDSKKNRQIAEIKNALTDRIAEMGIETWVEVKELPDAYTQYQALPWVTDTQASDS